MCEHGYRPSLKGNGCPFPHSGLKDRNTKRYWGTVYQDNYDKTISNISDTYKSITDESKKLRYGYEDIQDHLQEMQKRV